MLIGKTLTCVLAAALCLPGAVAQERAQRDGEVVDKRGQGGQQAPADGNGTGRNDEATSLRATTRPLRIFVLEGNGALNDISSGTATAPVVEVRDERNVPVPAVEVLFRLPSDGPGGFFAGRRLSWSAVTDFNGQAAAPSLTPNYQAGPFGIQVTATQGGSSTRAMITQRNLKRNPSISPRGGKHSLWWKVLATAAVGGAVVAGVSWATHGSDAKPTAVLQPGSISFSGPR